MLSRINREMLGEESYIDSILNKLWILDKYEKMSFGMCSQFHREVIRERLRIHRVRSQLEKKLESVAFRSLAGNNIFTK